MFANLFKSKPLQPGQKEYKVIEIQDTYNPLSPLNNLTLTNPYKRAVKKWSSQGWLLEDDQVAKKLIFGGVMRRLTFSKGSIQVAEISKPIESIADEIQKLSKLKDLGILTDEEFQTKKKQLLS
jgi:hypothetical protein